MYAYLVLCQELRASPLTLYFLCSYVCVYAACFLSAESTACSATQPVGEVAIMLNSTNILTFHDLTSRYIYAIQGLVMEDVSENPCVKSESRWIRDLNATCSSPSTLEPATVSALEYALYWPAQYALNWPTDVTRSLECDAFDLSHDPNIQLNINGDCYTHVHKDHLNIYDFSGWVSIYSG